MAKAKNCSKAKNSTKSNKNILVPYDEYVFKSKDFDYQRTAIERRAQKVTEKLAKKGILF